MRITDLIACPACDLLHRKRDIPVGTAAYCRRCSTSLYRGNKFSLDRPLALVLGGLIVFGIANVYPFLALQMEGRTQETVLVSGVVALYRQGQMGLSALVLLMGVVCPFGQLAGLLYILLPLRLGLVPPHLARVCRWVRRIQPWAMIEIFLLGTLVTVVKLSETAGIVPGIALFAIMALIFIVPAATAGLHWESIWQRVPCSIPPTMAAGQALASCRSCDLVCGKPGGAGAASARCPRCGAVLHNRKPASMARTCALVISAMILYIPANVLPVTVTTSMGQTQTDTILSGVIHFMMSGSWHIALIILIASIMVPLAKLAVLIYLLISVRFKSTWRPADRTRLYHWTEVVGRWSMVDIFAVTVLVALVRMDLLASVQAGPGGIFFAAVVVITMLAAECFDPRLIWDAIEEHI